MLISPEAKDTMSFFSTLQRLGLMDKSEEFDRFYVWMRQVEQYAEEYKSR